MGQRWRMLCIRAEGFQSVNTLDCVRTWNTMHQHMNNESLWWMLLDFMHSTVFVFRKLFPKVHKCTYNLLESLVYCMYTSRKDYIYNIGAALCWLMGSFTVVYRGISSINCLFMQPWNQRISTTRNWEGNAQLRFQAKQKAFSLFQFQCWPPLLSMFLYENLFRDYRRKKKNLVLFFIVIACSCCWVCCPLVFSPVAVFPCAYRMCAPIM